MTTYIILALLESMLDDFVQVSSVLDNHRSLTQICEAVQKKVKSFEVFRERLDLSSRIRLNAQLQRVQEAANLLIEALIANFGGESTQNKYSGMSNEEIGDEFDRMVEDFRQESDSFIDTLEKTEECYLKQHAHFPEAVHSKSEMVGLSLEYSKFKRDILLGERELLVYSLVGTAGIGKTALANKLFQDLDTLEFFKCRAWVTIGREYQLEEIIQNILIQLGVDEHNMLTEGYLGEFLAHNHCFIVLDDVWDMELVQNSFKTSSPITTYSTILVTSRIQHPHSFGYHLTNMRLLNKQESLNLLCDKIFAQNFCPVELEEAVKMIAEKCDGLPLTIVKVADLLSRTPRS